MEEQEAPLRYSRSRWIFIKKEDRPYVEYLFHVSEAGSYDIAFHMAATTPVVYERKHYIGYSVIEGELCIQNTVDDENNQFFLSAQWTREAYNNIKITRGNIVCKKRKKLLALFWNEPVNYTGAYCDITREYSYSGILFGTF